MMDQKRWALWIYLIWQEGCNHLKVLGKQEVPDRGGDGRGGWGGGGESASERQREREERGLSKFLLSCRKTHFSLNSFFSSSVQMLASFCSRYIDIGSGMRPGQNGRRPPHTSTLIPEQHAYMIAHTIPKHCKCMNMQYMYTCTCMFYLYTLYMYYIVSLCHSKYGPKRQFSMSTMCCITACTLYMIANGPNPMLRHLMNAKMEMSRLHATVYVRDYHIYMYQWIWRPRKAMCYLCVLAHMHIHVHVYVQIDVYIHVARACYIMC